MYCEKCGKKLINSKCVCGFEKFNNPIPVSVAIIPVIKNGFFVGFLGVQRGIKPSLGEIALPGGFQEVETIHSALIREVKEECNLDVLINESIQPLVYSSEPVPNRLLVFIVTHPIEFDLIDWSFKNEETLSLRIIMKEDSLAFPLHTKAKNFFWKILGD